MIAPINKNEKKYKYNVYQTANKAFCLRPSQDSKQRSTFSTPTSQNYTRMHEERLNNYVQTGCY